MSDAHSLEMRDMLSGVEVLGSVLSDCVGVRSVCRDAVEVRDMLSDGVGVVESVLRSAVMRLAVADTVAFRSLSKSRHDDERWDRALGKARRRSGSL